jgi:hypothetical protein
MNRRAPVQKQHERAVMLDFLEWYNCENDTDFAIYTEPDPPDALIKDGEVKRWLEVADAFYSNEWAKTQMSHVTPGEENHPWSGGRQMNMDEKIANRCVDILRKKLTKKTYKPFAAEFGPGILLMTLQYPWLSAETFEDIDRRCSKADWSGDLMCFSDVYLVYPSMNRNAFARWEYA